MITGTSEYLTPISETHVCGDHGTPLTVAWLPKENTYALRCGKDHYPAEVTRIQSLTEGYKAGDPEVVGLLKPMVPETDLATGERLSPVQISLLMGYAERYGLDVYRGHVCLMFGRPYPTVEGLEYHARNLRIPFSLKGRPLGKYEMESLGYQEGDIGFVSTVRRIDTGEEAEGLGFITMAEREEMSVKTPTHRRYPVVAQKWGNMVIKRAEWQALRRMFPLGVENGSP